MRTYADLQPGDDIRGVVVRAIEPCGQIVDVQFYDSTPDRWHTFVLDDPIR